MTSSRDLIGRPVPDVERSLRLALEQRDARIEAQRVELEELQRRLEEQYRLVARYRTILWPLLSLRRFVRAAPRTSRSAARWFYKRLQRFVWRHPKLTAPLRWLKRVVLGVRADASRELYTPVFDGDWYVDRYPEVTRADPLEHFLTAGWKQGKDPCPLFDVDWYIERAGDVGGDPLRHYLTHGWRNGWNPSPFFSVDWYQERHPPDPGDPDHEPLGRYLEGGLRRGDSTCASHHDVIAADPATRWSGRVDPLGESHELRSLEHRVGDGCVVFDSGALVLDTRGSVAPYNAVARYLGLEIRRRYGPGLEPPQLVGGAQGPGDLEDEVRRAFEERGWQVGGVAGALGTAFDEFHARWSLPRTSVTRVLHGMIAAGYRDKLTIRETPHAGLDLLSELGIQIANVRVVREMPADAETHIADAPPDREPATTTIVVPPYADAEGEPIERLRDELSAAARLHIEGQGLEEPSARRVVRAAFGTALLPAAVVVAALEHAYIHGIDRVHYLSREGHFLARVHRRIAERLVLGEAPRPVHLAVSRRSTFGPSMTSFDERSLMDLWRMYSRQSVNALLASLGEDPEWFHDHARSHDLDPGATIENIHEDPRVHAFLRDPVVTHRLEGTNRSRRRALLRYLQQRTDLDADHWVVADVGWRGTIQDNLARLLPDAQFDGWYFALFPFLNPQARNVSKEAVGPDGNGGDDFEFMEPPAAIERPWTADVPSVVSYELVEDVAIPIEEREQLGSVQSDLLALFQGHQLEATEIAAEWILSEGFTARELRPQVRGLARRYYESPWPGVADLWFGSEHDDTFGVLNVTPFGKERPDRRWLNQAARGSPMTLLDEAARDSVWPAGYYRWLPVQALLALKAAFRTGEFR